jgi:ribonuclease P protein component
VGCAVVRNRVKRILRDVFRRNREQFDLPLDLVVNARASVLERPVPQLERDFLECFQKVSRRFRP